jgi:2'-5' RNA ligase
VQTADEQTRRLFVAAPLPETAVLFAGEAQKLLPHTGGLRLVAPGQLHCTLAFIGQADSGKTEAAKSVVEGIPAECGGWATLSGFLLLPNPRRATVVALGIDDQQDVLARLYERVMQGFEAAGVMRREKRPFRAHVTVARLRVPGAVQPTSDSGRVVFGVESVCLYESELRREGAVHTVLVRRVLQKANGQ